MNDVKIMEPQMDTNKHRLKMKKIICVILCLSVVKNQPLKEGV